MGAGGLSPSTPLTLTTVHLPLAASQPPLSCRAFIACTDLRCAFWVTNSYHTHTSPGVRYYQYNNDVPVSAPTKSFMQQNQSNIKHKRTVWYRRTHTAVHLVDCCVHTSDVFSRQRLRSANRRQLVVPRHRRSKFGRRSFSVAAPMVWNSFPDSPRDPTRSIDNFRSTLKTHLFAAQRDTQRIRGEA